MLLLAFAAFSVEPLSVSVMFSIIVDALNTTTICQIAFWLIYRPWQLLIHLFISYGVFLGGSTWNLFFKTAHHLLLRIKWYFFFAKYSCTLLFHRFSLDVFFIEATIIEYWFATNQWKQCYMDYRMSWYHFPSFSIAAKHKAMCCIAVIGTPIQFPSQFRLSKWLSVSFHGVRQMIIKHAKGFETLTRSAKWKLHFAGG